MIRFFRFWSQLFLVLGSMCLAGAAPTITSFTPTSGGAATTVTVTGTNFTGATAVKFNGKAVASYNVVSATSITAVTPTGVTTGKITVTTSGGTATSSSSFTAVAAPTITSFTPTKGGAATTVDRHGEQFHGSHRRQIQW